jgi:hypothetical protein
MPTDRSTLAAAINASGLWAAYGDAAGPLGFGGSARACASANWEVNARLARADGSTDSGDPTKGEAWVAAHPAEVAVSEALGYPEGEPLPQELRLSAADVEALAGLIPSTTDLRLRISGQTLRLEEWLEASPAGTPHSEAVAAALASGRALLRALAPRPKT